MITMTGDMGMTYIRIKIKYLLIISAAALLVLLAAVFLQGSFLYLLGRVNETMGDTGRAGVFYDRAVEEFPGSAGSLAAAESKLELMFREKDFGYLSKLKLTGWSSLLNGPYINGSGIDSINTQYESISRFAARNDAFARYTIYAGMANYFGGYGEEAVSLLESTDYIKDNDLEQMRRLNLAAVYMDLGDMEKGYGLIKDRLESKDRYSGIRNALNRYYCFMTGQLELFNSLEYQRDTWYKDTKELTDPLLKPLLDINNTITGYGEIAGLKDKQGKTGNVFSGRVTDEGKPVAFAMVYLKEADKRNGDSSLMGAGDGIRSLAVTDADGYFRMEDVPDGIYGMGISLEWPRVQGKAYRMYKNFDLKFDGGDSIEKNISFFSPEGMATASEAGGGKLEFKVKLPPDAAGYSIIMGELRQAADNTLVPNNTFYSEELKTSEYILDTGAERRKGMLTGASYSTAGIDPRDLMEPFYHTGDYAYQVTFYDSRGNIMFDSNGIYPGRQKNILRVEGREWSEADRLLLEKKYDEAIPRYEALVDDPEAGTHALKVLAKLYFNGWIYNDKTFSLDGKDRGKALKYFTMLADRIPDCNDSIRMALADLYIGAEDYAHAIGILAGIESDDFSKMRTAQVYGYMGDFSRAVEYYKEFNDKTWNGAARMLMLYILQDRNELLPDTASRFMDDGSYYADYPALIREYLRLDTSGYNEFFGLIRQNKPDAAEKLLAGRSDDLALLYRGLLLLQKHIPDYTEREKLYKALYDRAENKAVKQLMKCFGKEGVQSGFGDY